jgi:Tfp pilus assembly protein PilV
MRRRSQRGFTTIEVLQACALSSVAMVGLSSLLFTTMHGNIHARDVTAAANVAQAKIEELRGISYALVASGSDSVTSAGTSYTRTWTISTGPTAGTKEVLVSVSGLYQQAGAVKLRTIIGS